MADPSNLPVSIRRRKPRPILDGLANFHGPLAPDIKRRLRAVIENPTSATWDQAHGLLLTHGLGVTLWQAVCCVDPTFPHEGAGHRRSVALWRPPSRALRLAQRESWPTTA